MRSSIRSIRVTSSCVLRRLEMDAKDLHGDFLHSFDGMQVGGFHAQTLTAVWFA